MHRIRSTSTGWSLLEQSIVLAVLAVLCALLLPSMSDALDRWRTDMLRMRLVSVFNSARATAITRHQRISVCPSADGATCDSDWRGGWLIRRHPADSEGALVLHHHAVQPYPQVRVHASQGRAQLTFQADGRSAGSTLTLDLCAGERWHSQVIVNNVGRTRSTRIRASLPCPD